MLVRVLLAVAVAYVGLCALLYVFQEGMIFFPQPAGARPAADPIELERGGVRLRGWIVNGDVDGPVLVYFGGNAEEVSHLARVFGRLPAAAVLVNYRGYGDSEGRPGARALLEDAAYLIDTVRSRWPGRELVVFGRSLGSGIAAIAAARAGADRLVLMSPYRSIGHIAASRFPFMPVRLLLRHDIDAAAVAGDLPPRTLVLHARRDRVVPDDESRALAAMLDSPQVVVWDGPHNIELESAALWPAIAAFVATGGPPAG